MVPWWSIAPQPIFCLMKFNTRPKPINPKTPNDNASTNHDMKDENRTMSPEERMANARVERHPALLGGRGYYIVTSPGYQRWPQFYLHKSGRWTLGIHMPDEYYFWPTHKAAATALSRMNAESAQSGADWSKIINQSELIRTAFTLGFMMSREGFNGECAYEHCYDGVVADHMIESDFFEHMNENESFQDGLAVVLARLLPTNLTPDPN